jgi:hypothetical protein
MELPTIAYLTTGLVTLAGYHIWDKRLRKRHCSQCGTKIKALSKHYCHDCFEEKINARAALKGGEVECENV